MKHPLTYTPRPPCACGSTTVLVEQYDNSNYKRTCKGCGVDKSS